VSLANNVHERQQLPLRIAWAFTIHKSQGLTLPACWVDIGKKELTLGITYVAISRVQKLSSLVMEPITYDRLTKIKENYGFIYRQTEERRSQSIAEQCL
jgi:ATP-dependent DNA helicase PIF1